MPELHAHELEGLVQLLQIVDQEVSPWAVDCLDLADDSFLKIKTALPPAEDFRDRAFSFHRTKNSMAHRAMLKVNLAVSTPGFESETTASLTQTAHLQNLRSGELIQVPDERMARVHSFGRGAR